MYEEGLSPAQLRKEYWSRFYEISKDWPKIINTDEGPITWSKSRTGQKMRFFKAGESALLHFTAAARLLDLLKHSRLATVEVEGDANVQEVHKRYAWARFPNGELRHILLTIDRMSDKAPPALQEADQAYSEEVLGISLEVLPENENADAVNLKEGDNKLSPIQAFTLAQNNLNRFIVGVKVEHRFIEETSFALLLGELDAKLTAMFDPFQRSPELREKIGLEALKRAKQAAANWESLALDNRTIKSIEREARVREALAFDQFVKDLTQERMTASDYDALSLEDEALFKNQPIIRTILAGYGRFMSRTEAIKTGRLLSDGLKGGDYDGAPTLPGWMYGGAAMFDQIAQFWEISYKSLKLRRRFGGKNRQGIGSGFTNPDPMKF